eukprot:5766991-Amphidinium_carterae.1
MELQQCKKLSGFQAHCPELEEAEQYQWRTRIICSFDAGRSRTIGCGTSGTVELPHRDRTETATRAGHGGQLVLSDMVTGGVEFFIRGEFRVPRRIDLHLQLG